MIDRREGCLLVQLSPSDQASLAVNMTIMTFHSGSEYSSHKFSPDFLVLSIFFQSNFRFRTKLNKKFPYVPPYVSASPTFNIAYQSGTFVRISEPAFTNHCHPKFKGFSLGVVHSVGFNQYVMTCIHHYNTYGIIPLPLNSVFCV
jgi:hypothetical protein